MDIQQVLKHFNLNSPCSAHSNGLEFTSGRDSLGVLTSMSPVDGLEIAQVGKTGRGDYDELVSQAQKHQKIWQQWPAPQRGEVVRQIGQALREAKEPLGYLVSYEMGKSLQEGLGEVQEMIDICDFSVGLSRQLYGSTMHSERPMHRMYEQWHPLGVFAIISAFNFPVAVWSWNAMIGAVCGNASIWKPSEKTPLTALACFKIIQPVLKKLDVPTHIMSLMIGDVEEIGEPILHDKRISLVSATGSTAMGRHVAEQVGKRLGKSILELGGNNAMIIEKDADLKLCIPALAFGAVGTAGQRCTSTRRAIIDQSIFSTVSKSLVSAYKSLKIGSPLDPQNHVGPLIDKDAVSQMQNALKQVKEQGGEVLYGGEVLSGSGYESGCYITPALVKATKGMPLVAEETFAPILYLLSSSSFEESIEIQNSVDHGLSSAVFTNNLKNAERFLSAMGSDCGIANVNIGTSGAEIGGAFGGEKDTGGGRESGSDAWKAYMRRQTNTINYGDDLPLAQGVDFKL